MMPDRILNKAAAYTWLFERSLPEPNSGCFLWSLALGTDGYGYVNVGGKKGRRVGAHRVAYELICAPIPAGLDIDHLCRTRSCVNPSHLEPVTRKENLRRAPWMIGAARKAKTHCVAGHARTPENKFLTKDGGSECRICRNERSRLWHARRRASKSV
jgi:hypothetical protein